MSIDFDIAIETMNANVKFPEPVKQSLRRRYPELEFLFDELDERRRAELEDGDDQKTIEDLEDQVSDLSDEVMELQDRLDDIRRLTYTSD